jgi:hypothetical protein
MLSCDPEPSETPLVEGFPALLWGNPQMTPFIRVLVSLALKKLISVKKS